MIHRILFVVLFFSSITTFSQYEPDKHIVGPSVGFSFLGSTTQIGINHESAVMIKELGFDKPGMLGVGLIFRYWNYSENFNYVEWDYTDIMFGLQTNYHFYFSNDRIDPWIGFIFAYDFGSVDIKYPEGIVEDTIEPANGGLWIGAHAGARYWFRENMAISIRIGFGTLSYGALDLGFDYKFN